MFSGAIPQTGAVGNDSTEEKIYSRDDNRRNEYHVYNYRYSRYKKYKFRWRGHCFGDLKMMN